MSVFVDWILSRSGDPECWRWMFATMGVPVLAFVLGLILVPESPRWLAAVGRVKEALGVLTRINGQIEADKVLHEIEDELKEESGGFSELRLPGVRLALIIGIALMVYSQIDGCNMIILYSPSLLLAAGVKARPAPSSSPSCSAAGS